MDQPSDIAVRETADPRAWTESPFWAKRAVVVPTFAVLALIGGLLPSFSVVANLYVLVLGGGMAYIGFTRRLPQRGLPRRVTPGVLWWLLPVGVLTIFEVATYAGGSTPEFPTLSLLTDPLLDAYAPRAALYYCWLAGFWGLCRR